MSSSASADGTPWIRAVGGEADLADQAVSGPWTSFLRVPPALDSAAPDHVDSRSSASRSSSSSDDRVSWQGAVVPVSRLKGAPTHPPVGTKKAPPPPPGLLAAPKKKPPPPPGAAVKAPPPPPAAGAGAPAAQPVASPVLSMSSAHVDPSRTGAAAVPEPRRSRQHDEPPIKATPPPPPPATLPAPRSSVVVSSRKAAPSRPGSIAIPVPRSQTLLGAASTTTIVERRSQSPFPTDRVCRAPSSPQPSDTRSSSERKDDPSEAGTVENSTPSSSSPATVQSDEGPPKPAATTPSPSADPRGRPSMPRSTLDAILGALENAAHTFGYPRAGYLRPPALTHPTTLQLGRPSAKTVVAALCVQCGHLLSWVAAAQLVPCGDGICLTCLKKVASKTSTDTSNNNDGVKGVGTTHRTTAVTHKKKKNESNTGTAVGRTDRNEEEEEKQSKPAANGLSIECPRCGVDVTDLCVVDSKSTGALSKATGALPATCNLCDWHGRASAHPAHQCGFWKKGSRGNTAISTFADLRKRNPLPSVNKQAHGDLSSSERKLQHAAEVVIHDLSSIDFATTYPSFVSVYYEQVLAAAHAVVSRLACRAGDVTRARSVAEAGLNATSNTNLDCLVAKAIALVADGKRGQALSTIGRARTVLSRGSESNDDEETMRRTDFDVILASLTERAQAITTAKADPASSTAPVQEKQQQQQQTIVSASSAPGGSPSVNDGGRRGSNATAQQHSHTGTITTRRRQDECARQCEQSETEIPQGNKIPSTTMAEPSSSGHDDGQHPFLSDVRAAIAALTAAIYHGIPSYAAQMTVSEESGWSAERFDSQVEASKIAEAGQLATALRSALEQGCATRELAVAALPVLAAYYRCAGRPLASQVYLLAAIREQLSDGGWVLPAASTVDNALRGTVPDQYEQVASDGTQCCHRQCVPIASLVFVFDTSNEADNALIRGSDQALFNAYRALVTSPHTVRAINPAGLAVIVWRYTLAAAIVSDQAAVRTGLGLFVACLTPKAQSTFPRSVLQAELEYVATNPDIAHRAKPALRAFLQEPTLVTASSACRRTFDVSLRRSSPYHPEMETVSEAPKELQSATMLSGSAVQREARPPVMAQLEALDVAPVFDTIRSIVRRKVLVAELPPQPILDFFGVVPRELQLYALKWLLRRVRGAVSALSTDSTKKTTTTTTTTKKKKCKSGDVVAPPISTVSSEDDAAIMALLDADCPAPSKVVLDAWHTCIATAIFAFANVPILLTKVSPGYLSERQWTDYHIHVRRPQVRLPNYLWVLPHTTAFFHTCILAAASRGCIPAFVDFDEVIQRFAQFVREEDGTRPSEEELNEYTTYCDVAFAEPAVAQARAESLRTTTS